MDPKQNDEYGILRLQERILEILTYVDSFCAEWGVEYFLSEGTALGAVREKGFIPWDDDGDIMMRPREYEKFRRAFHAEGDAERFYLQEWGAHGGMISRAKLRLNGTTQIQKELINWQIHHGISIDIFILHNAPDGGLPLMWQYLWNKYLVVRWLANMDAYTPKSRAKALAVRLMRPFGKRALLPFALKRVYKYENRPTNNVCNYIGTALKEQGLYSARWFGEMIRAPFENAELSLCNDAGNYMRTRYGGDYMTPAGERRVHADIWDADTDFRVYDARYVSFEDERYLI